MMCVCVCVCACSNAVQRTIDQFPDVAAQLLDRRSQFRLTTNLH